LPLFSVVQKVKELLNNYINNLKSWWSSTRASTIRRRIFVLFVISTISVNQPLLARQSLHQKPLSPHFKFLGLSFFSRINF